LKFKTKPVGKFVYGVAAFNGLVTQYWGDNYKDAEDAFYKSHTATHLYKMVGSVKEVIKENQRRMRQPGAIALAFGK
jgi:hypothetical protein